MTMRSSRVWNTVQVFKDTGDIKGLPNHFDQATGEWIKLPSDKPRSHWRSQKDMYKHWDYITKQQQGLIKAYEKATGRNRKMLATELKKYGLEGNL